jgi:hypothetical protein
VVSTSQKNSILIQSIRKRQKVERCKGRSKGRQKNMPGALITTTTQKNTNHADSLLRVPL